MVVLHSLMNVTHCQNIYGWTSIFQSPCYWIQLEKLNFMLVKFRLSITLISIWFFSTVLKAICLNWPQTVPFYVILVMGIGQTDLKKRHQTGVGMKWHVGITFLNAMLASLLVISFLCHSDITFEMSCWHQFW